MYAVFFDIDGTLIQTGGAGQLAFAETFADQFGVPQLSSRVSFAGRSDRAIAIDLMAEHGVGPNDENWSRFHDAYVGRLPDALARRKGRILLGVQALLESLRQRDGALVGLLTGNVRKGAQAKLSHYGLDQEFPFGGFGDDTTCRNEIAGIAFRAAEQHLQVGLPANGASKRLDGAMVIGDTVFDIRCARAIGAFAVAVPTGDTPADALRGESPDLLVETLEDAARLLQVVDDAVRPH